VVFGDSLSDDGNSYVATNGQVPPGPPAGDYGETFDPTGPPGPFLGRFTDGENWVDYFPGIAKGFGVNISPVTAYLQNPNNDSATDFAVGGSTSADLNVINGALRGLQSQISNYGTYLNIHGNAADDLCIIWCGANDFFARIKPLETVANIKSAIAQLSQAGAKHIVLITVPEFGLTPQERALGGAKVFAATQFVVTTNVLLAIELPRIALANQIRIDLVDINAIFGPVVFQPARFGFTNSSGFAYRPPNGPLLVNLVNDNPNNYVFWDGFHPTTNVHKLAAAFIFKNIFLSGQIRPFLSFR
jgi:phospholipase/lecithinase/hemolysin